MYIRKYGGKTMNKKVKVTSLAAAALTSMVLANANVNHEVKADVVSEGTSTKAPSAQDNAQANVESAQKEVDNAQADVNAAKSKLDSARTDAENTNAVYNAQNTKTQAAQKEKSDKQLALDNAQAAKKQAEQLAADANDPAKVKQANDDVTKKQGALKDAQDAQAAADQKVTDQNSKIASDQTTIDDAKKVRDQKQGAKIAADDQVKTAEDALKGTGVKEAEDAYNESQAKQTEISGKLAEKTQKKITLEGQQNELTSQIQEAAGERQKAAGDVQKYTSQLGTIDGKVEKISPAISNIQNEIQELKNKLKELKETSQNKITIHDLDKYKTALADYFKGGKSGNPLTDADNTYMDEERNQNHYISSEEDKKESVDLNHMTDEQIQDLSLFAAHLTTQLRSQFGWKADVVTKGSIEFGKEVAQGYLADYKTFPSWHDDARLQEAAGNHKLYRYEEDMGGDIYYNTTTTMDRLKHGIYDLFNSMFFTNGGVDSPNGKAHPELGHAVALLGAMWYTDINTGEESIQPWDYANTIPQRFQLNAIKQNLKQASSGKSGFVLSYEDQKRLENEIKELQKEIDEAKQGDISLVVTNYGYQTKYGDYDIGYHFLRSTPKKDSNYDLTVIPSYTQQIANLNTQIARKSSLLNGLQGAAKKLADAKKYINDNLLTPAQKKVKAAQQKVEGLQKQQDKLAAQFEELNTQISELSGQLKEAQKTAQQNKQKLDDLTADHKTKVENLAKAQKAQEDAKSALDDAQSKLDGAQKAQDKDKDDLKDLQKDAKDKKDAADQAQKDLETAQKHVEDLKKAPQALKDATDAEAKAQGEYDAAKKAADDAAAQLKKLEGEKSTADSQYATAQAAYNDALARLKAAQDKLAEAKAALNRIQNPGTTISIPGQSTSTSEKNNSNTSTSEDNSAKKTTTKKAKRVSDRVRLTHNAFVYTKSGKVIRKGLYYKIIRRGRTIKTLKNAKVVTIKGKKFYQIGKNQYIKVANTKVVPYAISRKAIIKGRRVRAYNRSGKFNMHYVKGGRVYKFNERAVINGKTYYKITWTNNWIPASKLSFR